MDNGQLIGTPKELTKGEARVAMTPESATQLQKLGYRCAIQSGAGQLQASLTLIMKQLASK
jgi:NAD(P) transhydrogenase subunit alpha